MIIYPYTAERFGSEEIIAKISPFPTEVYLSAQLGLAGVIQQADIPCVL